MNVVVSMVAVSVFFLSVVSGTSTPFITFSVRGLRFDFSIVGSGGSVLSSAVGVISYLSNNSVGSSLGGSVSLSYFGASPFNVAGMGVFELFMLLCFGMP